MKNKNVYFQIFACKCDPNGKFHTSAMKATDVIFKNEADAEAYCQTQCKNNIIYVYREVNICKNLDSSYSI